MKAVQSLFIFQCLIFMNSIGLMAQDIDTCLSKIFDEQTRSALGSLTEYRENTLRYDKASDALHAYDRQIDSLKNTFSNNIQFSEREKKALTELISLAGNYISGDTHSFARDLSSNLILKLNQYIPFQNIYEIERKYIKEIRIKGEVLSWARGLCQFVMEDAIPDTGPHAIDVPGLTLETEIQFYNCKKDEVIINIGSKLGNFEKSLSKYSDNLTVYASEMHPLSLEYLKVKLGLLQIMDRKEITFTCVLGGKQSLQLPKNSFDKVMVRNIFHHFSEKKAMLDNIKRILKKDGRLFITEFLPDGLNSSPECEALLSRNDLLQILNSNNFVLSNEKKLPNSTLVSFEFKVR